MTRRLAVLGVLAVLAAACTDKLTTPGQCPAFCPGGDSLQTRDTIFTTIISRDSAYRGFVSPYEAAVLLAAEMPGVDSRPIWVSPGIPLTRRYGVDTVPKPVLGADSAKILIHIGRYEAGASNLRLKLYHMPQTIDSNTTFADVSSAFTDSLIDSLNVDSVLAMPNHHDTITGDSIAADTVNHALTIFWKLTAAQLPFVFADSGRQALGVQIAADSLASIAISTVGSANVGPGIIWYTRVDSAGVTRADTVRKLSPSLHGFVLNPGAAPLDSNLAIGGIPTARSLLRMKLPRFIRDSSFVVRATLLLVPSQAAQGVQSDSFVVYAQRVEADFGGKSPLAVARFLGDSAASDTAGVRIGATDTVRFEILPLVRLWQADTTSPQAIMLVLRSHGDFGTTFEGGTLAEIRFYSSRNAALRPALRVTYIPRFKFGHQ
ncbi:MAG TPA: hypothetical protein VNH63_00465 [Gemmatimonadales bacterium]|nr:hypothetical protein [Gemmatimonadales bacterium]